MLHVRHKNSIAAGDAAGRAADQGLLRLYRLNASLPPSVVFTRKPMIDRRKFLVGTVTAVAAPRNADCKPILDSPGKVGKLKELIVLRMAFKRSGVRLPLAPPNISPMLRAS